MNKDNTKSRPVNYHEIPREQSKDVEKGVFWYKGFHHKT